MSKSLTQQLERVRMRVRFLSAAFGFGWVLVALSVAAVTVVGADYLLNLKAWPRVVALLGAAVVLGVIAWRRLLKPMLTRVSLSDVAARVELAFPQFDDRLRSVVTFGAPGDEQTELESRAMRERTRTEAERIAETVNMRHALNSGPAKKLFIQGVAALAVVVVLGAVVPGEYRGAAWARLAHPFGNHAWPKRTLIAREGELPSRVPAGERLPVKVRLSKGDKASARTTVFYQYGAGPVRSELMTRGDDGVYSASLDARAGENAAEEMKVWVKAGDDEMSLGTVNVVPRLAVKSVIAEVTPPAYARAGGNARGGEFDLVRSPVGVVEGSEVVLSLGFNKPLASVPVLKVINSEATTAPGAKPVEVAAPMKIGAEFSDAKAVLKFVPEKTLRFRLEGVDADGFKSAGLSEYEIAVRPDAMPSVQIELPRRSEERTAVATVPLEAVAEDDFAVPAATLHIRRLNDSKDWHIPLVTGGKPEAGIKWEEAASSPERSRMRMGYLWELKQLGVLKGGDVLEYFVSVEDNYVKRVDGKNLRHPPATSSRMRITIVTQEEFASRVADDLRNAAGQIEQVRSGQQRTTEETGELAQSSRSKPQLDDGQRQQLKRLGEQQSVATGQAKQVAGRLTEVLQRIAENKLEAKELAQTAKDVRDMVDRAGEGPMRDAASALSNARTADRGNERNSPKDASRDPSREGNSQSPEQKGERNAERNGAQSPAERNTPEALRQGEQQNNQQGGQQQNGQQSNQQSGQQNSGQQSSQHQSENNSQQQPQSREGQMQRAQENQKDAERMLGQALDKLSSLGTLRQATESLQRMLDEQKKLGEETRGVFRDNVGKTPEQMSKADQDKLQQLSNRQQELAKQTEKMLGDMEKGAQNLQKSDPESSQAMKKASETGRQQGVPGAQQKASQSMQQNQQSPTQASQKQAEIGLQVMLEGLKEAQRHKLEELAKKLADLKEQVANLIRRQAGHNLDNLGLRNDALAKLPDKDKLELGLLAERARDKLTEGDLRALSGGQEQTERNTRSISETASSTQGMGEAASALVRAASRMEAAAVKLRSSDIEGAYEPPQVEALVSLQRAMTVVEEEKKKADEQQEKERKDTLRAKYEALRAEQDGVLKETVRLQAIKTRAGEAGLPRTEAFKLAGMPGQEGGLAERTEKMEADLTEVGGVVYLWANKDVVLAMKEAKEGLGQKETGGNTQDPMARAIAGLDAMIESLTIKPPPPKEFEDRNSADGGGGGGGGQGQPPKQKMPPEAELKLLKANQAMLNKATAAQAKAGDVNKAKLADLAVRQGELRKLAGEMMKTASEGFTIPPELDRAKKLPEEGGGGAKDNSLDQELLEGTPADEKTDPKANALMDRMGRVRQRLGEDNDPGAITQKIQQSILGDLDKLMDEARKQQQQQQQQQQGKSQARQQGQQRPGSEQANNQGQQQQQGQAQQTNSRSAEGARDDADRVGKLGENGNVQGGAIAGRGTEWGGITPRQREAVIEGSQDKPIEQYRGLIEDYFKALAKEGSKP